MTVKPFANDLDDAIAAGGWFAQFLALGAGYDAPRPRVQPTSRMLAAPASQLGSGTLVSGGAGAFGPGVASPVAGSTLASGFTTGPAATPSWVSSLKDAVIKADMTAASAGGTVSEAALGRLFGDLATELTTSETTLSASQLADLQMIAANLNVGETASSYLTYITNALISGNAANAKWTGGAALATNLGNLAVGSTATQLNELAGKWFLGTDLPSCSLSYSVVNDAVFGTTGPSMNDINQGQLGDCYLLSSLAEVAYKNPTLIQSMITNNGNNTYGVRFFVDGYAEYVTVNTSLPDGGKVFNSATDIWASLVEKAYAQAQAIGIITGESSVNYGNSYSSIGGGGCPEWALEAITGASAITDFCANGSSWGEVVDDDALSFQSNSSGLTTASVLATVSADLAAGNDAVLSSRTNAKDSRGMDTLVSNHAMSIYGYDSTTGDLEIRNPWGIETGQYWDTTFEVSLSTLLVDGDTISVDNVTSNSPPAPLVTLAAAPTVSNGTTATLGTAKPGTGTDALKVTLTSDAEFATGSTLTLTNGSLIYTPGLITAAKAGSDTINYTVTDTVTGAVTTETQTVKLAPPPAPLVTLAAALTVSNGTTATLGTAKSGTGTDALKVTLTSDTEFATGSTLTLTNGSLIYTPGLITAAKAGSDTINYAVTDTVTGAVTTETQTVRLAPPPAPLVTLAAALTVSNGTTATLGTAKSGTGTDALKVTLTSDTEFATGSTLTLTNGSLIYTPGLITAAKAGSDTINYTVTDTVTGAVTTETQTVRLAPPPAPLVTLAAAPTASNGTTATLGTAKPGTGTDALKVTLTSDTEFATGSTLTLTNGSLIYTPGLITAAKAGSDTINYTVTDTVTGAVTTETQTVKLAPPPAPLVTSVSPGSMLNVTGTESIATLLDSGTVAIASGGRLDVSSAVDPSSTGIFQLMTKASLEIAAVSGGSLGIQFLGSTPANELTIGSAANFGTHVGTPSYAGPLLESFAAGDIIDLVGIANAGLKLAYASATGDLQIAGSSGNALATLAFQNSTLGAGTFHVASDGAGGTLLTHS